MGPSLPKRADVDPADTWNMYSIYPSDQVWQTEIDYIRQQLPVLQEFRGKLAEGPSLLADWFQVSEDVKLRLGKVQVYASGFRAVDTADQQAAARYDAVQNLTALVVTALSFAEPELLTIGLDKLQSWLKLDPRLTHYGHYLDTLEQRTMHIRSADVEAVLGLASASLEAARDTHAILADAELTFRPAFSEDGVEHIVAQGTIDALLLEPDRKLRHTAWESYADGSLAFQNTMASCMAVGAKQDVFIARARCYDSALQSALAETLIPEKVYHNALDTCRRKIPIWHRYWRLRQHVLGDQPLAVYDIMAPFAASPRVPFAQAMEWITAGLAPLGEEYVQILVHGVHQERWVDIYPNQNKSSGAFSTGETGTCPFILLNYTNDVDSLSALAHELGHSMHSYHTWRSQPYIYANYGIFVAEVASNLNQALVRDYLLRTHPERDMQIALCQEAMGNLHRYLFLMPILARFELEIHERAQRGEALTAEVMNNLLTGFFAEGYGGVVQIDEPRIGITWAQFPHHLYANFYVYQYATGIAAAQTLASGILNHEPGAAERYLAFLSAGNSLYPLEALRLAGVDMSLPEPMDAAFRYLEQIIARLESLLS